MLKRLCDKCETEITDDEIFFRIKYYGIGDSSPELIEEYDVCPGCFNKFKESFANNN